MGVRLLTEKEKREAADHQVEEHHQVMERLMRMLGREPGPREQGADEEVRAAWTEFLSEIVVDDGKGGEPS